MEAEAAKIEELQQPRSQIQQIQQVQQAQDVEPSTPEEAAPAVRSILGPDLFVGFDFRDLAASITDFFGGLLDARSKALERLPRLGTELVNALIGRSEIEPDP